MRLVNVTPSAVPPLALYQSPWTIALAIAFAFRGAGTYVIDDIDNAGVARSKEEQQDFRTIRKEILSKKGWTNCRPLAAFCPDGLLFANLSRADYTALDRRMPLAVLAKHRSTTVERLIRETSREHGMWSLAGPDQAITAVPMRTAATALRDIIAKHEAAVLRTLARPQDHEPALRRLRHLMSEPEPEGSLLDYFQQCLRRGLELVGSDAPVLSAARDLIPPDGGHLLPRFLQGDPKTIDVYNAAAALQGSRLIDADHPLPYYTVGLSDGVRADVTHAIRPAPDQVIAPKILALEGVAGMALPRTTAPRSTILAREHAYRGLASGSSQVFFDTDWLESLGSCGTEVHVDGIFQPLVGGRQTMPLSDLAVELLRHDEADEEDHQQDPIRLWTRWALHETLADLRTWHYPVPAYAVAGDRWLERLSLRSYTEYRSFSPAHPSPSGNERGEFMDVMTAVLTRRSEHRLVEPAPDDDEFAYLLRAAATAPDHGKLRPWRWILVRDEGRAALGRCFADDGTPDSRPDHTEAKTRRAPLLATLVFTPATGHRVPEWEQLAATSAMTSSLMLLLHARGFGSIWRTGKFTESARVRRLLGLQRDERLLGWLYIGTPGQSQPQRRRVPDDVTDRISVFAPDLVTS